MRGDMTDVIATTYGVDDQWAGMRCCRAQAPLS